MVKKLQKSTSSKKKAVPLSGSVKDSAQQIWQAGLGAFNKAQVEGSKAFEALVKEGVSLQRKTQSSAEEKLAMAGSKMSNMASDLSAKAAGQWDKLENIFEDRVAKVLKKLGVPSAVDVNALIARIDVLNKNVQRLAEKEAGPKAAVKTVAKTSVKPASKVAPQTAAKKAVRPAAKVARKTVLKPAVKPAAKPAVKRAPARKAVAAEPLPGAD